MSLETKIKYLDYKEAQQRRDKMLNAIRISLVGALVFLAVVTVAYAEEGSSAYLAKKYDLPTLPGVVYKSAFKSNLCATTERSIRIAQKIGAVVVWTEVVSDTVVKYMYRVPSDNSFNMMRRSGGYACMVTAGFTLPETKL